MASAYPSEAAVVFSDYQQLTSVDLNDAATLPQASLDNAVAAFLAAGQGYVGLPVSANSDALGVTVGTGTLYNLGGGFPLRAAAKIDLSAQINLIPDSVSSQIILIVANSGAALISETRTLEDASRKPTNPADLWPTVQQTVTTRNVRAATPSIVPGVVAATNVQVPAFNPLLCLLATVVIDQTGVVSVTQNTAEQITRLDQLAPIVNALANQAAIDKVSIASLQGQVSALAASDAKQFAAVMAQLQALASQVSAIDTRQVAQATGGTYTQVDNFVDGSLSTPAATYQVGSGLAFPPAASTPVGIQPLVPNASNYQITNGRYLTLPYVSRNNGAQLVAYPNSPYTTSVALNSLNPLSAQPMRKGFGVQRTRYGAAFPAQGTSQLLASGDPSGIFTGGGLTYNPSWPFWTVTNPELNHQNGFWKDLTGRNLWTPRTPLDPITNTPAIAMRYRGVASMVTQIGIQLQKGTQGDVRVLVCDEVNGAPDFSSVLDDVTVPYAAITGYGQTTNGGPGLATDPNTSMGCDATLSFPVSTPVADGNHWWIVVVSNGDHKLALVTQGYFDNAASNFQDLSLSSPDVNGRWANYPKAAAFGVQLFYPQFTQNPSQIPLPYLNQAGGIDAVDYIVPCQMPPGCDIRIGLIQPDGTKVDLGPIATATSGGGANLLAGRPSTLLPYMFLSANSAACPVIDIGASITAPATAKATRQSTGFVQETAPIVPPGGPYSTITDTIVFKGYDPTVPHTYSEVLETGAGYGTVTTPTSVVGPTPQADGTTLFTSTWTLSSPVASWKLKRTGNTSDATRQFTGVKATVTAK